jgi:hypothetical protein
MFTSTGFSFVAIGKRSTRVDSEPHLEEKLKAIRDKKERFFGTGKGRILALAPDSKRATGG